MAYPSTWKENVVEVQDGQEPDQLMIDEAITAARELGLSSLKWHVRVKEPASELEQWLERRGFTVTETTELLAWELGVGDRPSLPGITPLSGISVSLVDSLDKFRAAERVGCQVFQNRLPSDDELNKAWSAPRSADDQVRYASFLACIDGTPASAAGLTMADQVVRLWGAATLPEFRRKGGYRSLVLARSKEGHLRGASLAVVNARIGTSGPILKRMGFRLVGVAKQYEVAWGDW